MPAASESRRSEPREALYRAQHGSLLSRADFDDIYARCKRGKAQLLCDDYPAGDGFFAHPRDDDEAFQSRMAWDRTRDFLSFALL